ncbi:hypothetical protein CLU79DRAFT_757618 [Phycomyces nitens]|nr:hypothetical protein CLU79DRAFT_757618 [Phycomyces nitens]
MIHALIALVSIAVVAAEQTEKPVQVLKAPLTWRDFEMEMVLLAAFGLYILAWYQGKKANTDIAKKWVALNVGYLEEQFALVGSKTGTARSILVQDGPADFLLYLSGRRNVEFGHWWIKLKPRNDMLNYGITKVLSLFELANVPTDRVVLDITLDKAIGDRFVFAILPKTDSKAIHDRRYDLKSMTKLAQSDLPSNMVVYSESQKLADLLIAKVGPVITNCPGFDSLIISSMPAIEPEKFEGETGLTLSMTFKITLSKTDPLVQLACELPDTIAQLQLTPDIKATLRKNRESFEKQIAKRLAEERAEELVRKKAEAKRAEEERVKSLPPAEQRKWEEKERAREAKRAQKKRTKRG